jgi:CRP-like cAMP-binding protein/HEAT repeat protein
MLRKIISPILDTERKALYQVFLLGGYFLFIMAGATIGVSGIDALFLSNYDLSKLPAMYIYIAILSIFTSFAFQKLAKNLKTHYINYIILIFAATFISIAALLIQMGFSFVYPITLVGFEALYVLTIMSFYNFTANIFDTGQAKKYLGPITVGASIGGILGGFVTQIVSLHFGVVYLLYIYAFCLIVCMFFINPVIKVTGSDYYDGLDKAQPKSKKKKEASSLFKQIPHFKYLMILTISISIVMTFVDYQFRYVLATSLEEHEIGAFLGLFYIVVGIINVLVQAFGTSKILSSFGITFTYLLLPIFLVFSNVGLLFLPILFFGVAGEGTVQVVRNSFFNNVNELMFFPIPAKIRAKAKGFLDGMIKQSSRGLAGVLLVVLSTFIPFHYFSFISIFLLIICILAITQIKKGYLKLLVSNLTSNDLENSNIDLAKIDQASISLLEKSLKSQSDTEVLYAYRMLMQIPQYQIETKTNELLKHPSSLIKMEVLENIEGEKLSSAFEHVTYCLNEDDVQVKAQALKTYASYGDQCDVDMIKLYLNEDHPKVKGAAIYGLIKYHGIEGMYTENEYFKHFLESHNAEERSEAAEILGKLEVKTFYQTLIPLLKDSNHHVKMSALKAAGKIKDKHLVEHIILGVNSHETRALTINTLANYDAKVILPLFKNYFERDDIEARKAALYIPEVIGKQENQEGIHLLMERYLKSNTKLKTKISNTLAKCNPTIEGTKQIEKVIFSEINEEERYAKLLVSLSTPSSNKMLYDALDEERKNIIIRVFKLLSYINEEKTLNAVYLNLVEGDERAKRNALEVLDTILKEPLRTQILKLIVRMDLKKVHTGSIDFEEDLLKLYYRSSEWIKMTITSYLDDQEDLGSITPPHLWKETIKRVELIKKVPYFQHVPGSKLVEVISEMKEKTVRTGTVIIEEQMQNSSLFLLLEGELKVEKQGRQVGTLIAGSYFNELPLLDNGICMETVTSISSAKILELTYETLYSIIKGDIDISWNIMSVVNKKLRQTLEQVKEQGEQVPMDTADINEISEDLLLNNEVDKSIIDRILILFKVDLFKNLQQKDLIVLAHLLEDVEYKKGNDIVVYGESGTSFYAIVKGKVKVHKQGTQLAVLREGDYFGEMALIDGGLRTASVTALESCTCVRIERDEFINFCNQRKDVIENMLNIMTKRLRNTLSIITPAREQLSANVDSKTKKE